MARFLAALALLALLTPPAAAGDLPCKPPPGSDRKSFGDLLPTVAKRDDVFAQAGLQPELDRRNADDMDRDLIYVMSYLDRPDYLARNFPWLTPAQAVALSQAICKAEGR
ncbi:hypothetical protein HHL28_17505 [Aerophototrophica crusticola]|uniref:Uncharacterized protein n=1 Tax=Aerophototrophica crusticola TaxID=1709002 RepID=A0A858RB91_9PROT|nr:hypothetical protein HHL28_17505 [Rhodospirillaceae bacterium B3]